ncbi:hypothetical protein GCM10022219_11530 [Microbacterium oryzae]|uniref:Uncharacterized protein n=1 Tax=Microbacterium oryzae TaxID=743009 RepID=A0A6I6DTZ5_9MICO|nr:hypothetical protein [Microbacterium oryzae]QGU28475.1 hypothetical protein D7D94_12935 [Microbacterium oryzae]
MILAEVEAHGWTVSIETCDHKMFVSRNPSGELVRNVASVTRIPSRRLLYAQIFADAPAEETERVMRYLLRVAARGGWWFGPAGTRSRLEDGKHRFRIAIGRKIDVDEAFAEITKYVDLSSEVTA